MSEGSQNERRGRVTVRRFSSAAEADLHDLAYWRSIPDAERVLLAWHLTIAATSVSNGCGSAVGMESRPAKCRSKNRD